MAIELLIAPAGTGKTQACIGRIGEAKKGDLFAPVWVVVPNPQAAAQFKARLAAADSSMGVKVALFSHFYQDLLEKQGVFTPVISSALGYRLIQESVRDAVKAGELTHYAAIEGKPGFLSVLRDAFAELRSALVSPDDLVDYARGTSEAQRELAVLYQRFLTRLDDIGWIDSEGQAWLAIKALESTPRLADQPRLVVVDGFTAFTKAQRRFLALMGQQADEMVITLCGEAGSERMVDRRLQKVIEALKGDLSLEIVDRDSLTRPALSGDVIGQMERSVLNVGEVEKMEPGEALMIEARSQAEEAREALRWLKRLHLNEGIPLAECAIYCARLEAYRPLLRAAGGEFGMRIHFSQRDRLAESPAILAMMNLLSLALEGYPTRSLLNAFHSPYFDFGMESEDAANLEKTALEAVIVSGREQWEAAWTMLERKSRGLEDPDEESRSKDLTKGIDLAALQVRLDRFWELFDGIEIERSQAEWIEWLEGLLGQLGFYENIQSERDRAACKALGEALRALVVSEQVVGIQKIDYAQFLADLEGGLNGVGLEEERETRSNAVFVGKLVEARGARYQAVVLLGLSEGQFPVVENPDPFLDEHLRADLGLESRLEREQASTFYQAFTRAEKHLLLTRPYLSKDGERWEPSPYWRATTRLFCESAVSKIQESDLRPQSEAASGQELLFWGVQKEQVEAAGDVELSGRWQNLWKAGGVLDARRSKRARGVYEGDLSPIAAILGQAYSEEQVWSASRLETYSSCPYQFFASAALKLEKTELPEPGLDAAQVGSLYHSILELVYSRAMEQGADPLEILDETAECVFKTAPRKLGFRPTALWEVEKRQHLDILRKSVEAMEAVRGEWKPFAFESKFGIRGAPCLELEIDGEIIRIRGVIDRVDKLPSGEIRVIDYKTGSSGMGNKDLVEGTRLQLPLYAKAAQETLKLGEVVDGFYWSVKGAKGSSLTLLNFESEQGFGIDGATEIVEKHIINHIRSVRKGRFLPETPRGGCPDWCPANLWCWRYQVRYKYD